MVDFKFVLICMKNKIALVFFVLIIGIISNIYFQNSTQIPYGAPPYSEDDFSESPIYPRGIEKFGDLRNWKRPEGPPKIGIQVGHWKNSELPDELENIRGNAGASNKGVSESEVMHKIAMITKEILEEEGYIVDILPATVPPAYIADAFIALHADGSTTVATNGFKIASSRRDYTGNSDELVLALEEAYSSGVGFPKDPNITRNMTAYYAFSWWRYEHSIHPMTPAAIVETGFLTNPFEAAILINSPQIPAKAIAEGVSEFIKLQK